jgi:hypothetical protein
VVQTGGYKRGEAFIKNEVVNVEKDLLFSPAKLRDKTIYVSVVWSSEHHQKVGVVTEVLDMVQIAQEKIGC